MRKNDGYVSSNKGDVERSTTLLDRACGLCARSHREHQRVHWDAAWHAGKYIQAPQIPGPGACLDALGAPRLCALDATGGRGRLPLAAPSAAVAEGGALVDGFRHPDRSPESRDAHLADPGRGHPSHGSARCAAHLIVLHSKESCVHPDLTCALL